MDKELEDIMVQQGAARSRIADLKRQLILAEEAAWHADQALMALIYRRASGRAGQ